MFDTKSLDEIGVHFQTDKSSIDHNFLSFYEPFISSLRKKNIKILEIGLLHGKSIRTWEAYFPNAEIIGADIVPASKRFEKNRIKVEIVDQSNLEDLVRLGLKHGPFDIVIEDGSHMWEHQITSLRTIFPFVKDGGYYMVEDLQTNFGERYSHYRGVASISCVEYIKKLVDLRVGDDEVDIDAVEDAFLRTYGRSVELIAFAKRACVIKKKIKNAGWGVSNDRPLSTNMPNDAIRVSILAHVRNHGDIFSNAGFINIEKSAYIQGIEISSEIECLEFCLRTSEGQWTDWKQEGEFAGSRSELITFTGMAVRVNDAYKDRYCAELLCAYDGGNGITKSIDGEKKDQISNLSLYGVQIFVAPVV